MKTRTSRICLCIAICFAILCISSFATEPQTYSPDANGAYSVTYAGTAGNYYAMLIVNGTYTAEQTPTISEDTVIYISQETADADGNATFASFKPKEQVNGTIYIGGTDLDTAVLYGYLSDGTVVNATVSGTVTSASAAESTVTLTSNADETKIFTVTTTDGAYTISVPLDTYKFKVTKATHLSYTKNALEVAYNVTKDVTLKGGDTNGDDSVSELDLGDLLTSYNTVSASLDINADGIVSEIDLGEVLTNFGASSVVE